MYSQHRSIFYIRVYCYASITPVGVFRAAGGFESFRIHRGMVIFSESSCAHPEYVVCVTEERTPSLKIKDILYSTVFLDIGFNSSNQVRFLKNIRRLTLFSRFSMSIFFISISSNGDFAGRSL